MSNKLPPLIQNQKQRIIDLISEGMPISSICKELAISRISILNSQLEDPFFHDAIRKAREFAMHNHVDSLVGLADNCESLVDVGKMRIKSENIKWVASKIMPREYGDRMELTVNKGIDLSSVLVAAENRVVSALEMRKATAALVEARDNGQESSDSVNGEDREDEGSETGEQSGNADDIGDLL